MQNAIDAIVKRINRKLTKAVDGSGSQQLRKTLKYRVGKLGQFHIVDTTTGEVITPFVSLRTLAQQFGVNIEGVRFEGGSCISPETAINDTTFAVAV